MKRHKKHTLRRKPRRKPKVEPTPIPDDLFGLTGLLKEPYPVNPSSPAPIPMLLWCPNPDCGERHVDGNLFMVKPHHTHACQHCGMVWRPALVPTVGVQFLPGFKDDA